MTVSTFFLDLPVVSALLLKHPLFYIRHCSTLSSTLKIVIRLLKADEVLSLNNISPILKMCVQFHLYLNEPRNGTAFVLWSSSQHTVDKSALLLQIEILFTNKIPVIT